MKPLTLHRDDEPDLKPLDLMAPPQVYGTDLCPPPSSQDNAPC
jgi:hypothetical protein